MSTVFVLKVLCDVCFYLAFAGTVAGYFGGGDVLPAVALLALSAWAMGALHGRGRSPAPAFLLLPVCLLAAWGNPVNLLLLVPAVAYCIYCAAHMERFFGRLHYGSTFSLFLKAYPPFALVVLVIGGGSVLEAVSLPYAVLFLFGAVVLMRMLRHDAEVAAQPRFQALNALLVAVVLPVGWLLGSRTALSLAAAALRWLYFQVIAPLLLLLANLFAYLMIPLLSLFDFEGGGASTTGDAFADTGEALAEEFGETSALAAAIGRVLLILLAAAAAAGLVYLVVRLFRRLADDRAERASDKGIREYRTSLASPGAGGKAREKGAQHPVRRAYRKFLLACKSAGVTIEPRHTSRDVARSAATACGRQELPAEIRALYLPVRYGDEQSRDTAKEMKALCKAFQQTLKKK